MTRIFLTLFTFLITTQVFAASDPVDFVGAISINPSHDANVVADWYGKFGIETQKMNLCPKESHPCFGYFKVTGSWFFAIHPKRDHAPKKSSHSVDVVLHVSDYDTYIANAAKNKITPTCIESDSSGRFAHFIDPDGNHVSIWGQPNGQTRGPCGD